VVLSFVGLALTLLAGALIGATGIGGVLVVPILVAVEGLDLSHAIAASAIAFAFPGLLALWRLRRHPVPQDGGPPLPFKPLILGALPGALLGAMWVHQAQPRLLLGILGCVALASGVRGFVLRAGSATQTPVTLSTLGACALGAGVGVGSGLTGTGGPVLLVPLLLVLRQPLPATIMAAQAIQLPIALSAGLAHWGVGAIDGTLALVLGLCLLLGFLWGQWAARRVAMRRLQDLVNLLLVCTGLWFGWQIWNG
jgi:uncharacterized membrane protein YfcA